MEWMLQVLGAVLGALVASYCVAAPLDVLAATGEACAGSEDDCAHDVGAMHFLTVGILSARNGISVFTMEFTCTFALVWVYFASVVDPTSRAGGLAPISLGFAMIVGVIASGPGTGSSMSPARTLGPAIVLGHYAHCVAPVFGTLLGGIVAGMAYNYLFLFADDEPVPDLCDAPPAPPSQLRPSPAPTSSCAPGSCMGGNRSACAGIDRSCGSDARARARRRYRLTAEPGHHEAESFMRKRHAERALVEHGVEGYTPRNYTPLTETPPRGALPPGSKQTYV